MRGPRKCLSQSLHLCHHLLHRLLFVSTQSVSGSPAKRAPVRCRHRVPIAPRVPSRLVSAVELCSRVPPTRPSCRPRCPFALPLHRRQRRMRRSACTPRQARMARLIDTHQELEVLQHHRLLLVMQSARLRRCLSPRLRLRRMQRPPQRRQREGQRRHSTLQLHLFQQPQGRQQQQQQAPQLRLQCRHHQHRRLRNRSGSAWE